VGSRFIPLDFDFYKYALKGEKATIARSFGLRFGPAKLRFTWARIDKGLYIASKSSILEDLLQLEKSAKPQSRSSAAAAQLPSPRDHAMIRVRPQNWNQVLADFRLGWAENNREACLRNLGPLSSVARAFGSSESGVRNPKPENQESENRSQESEKEPEKKDDLSRRIHREADRLHTTHFFCPDGGQYRLAPDGKSMRNPPPRPVCKGTVHRRNTSFGCPFRF
jgi:hypothetical protein